MGEKWNDKCCNKFIERAIVCLCKGWFRGDLLFMIVRKLRPSAGDGELIIWIWRPPMVLCEIVISLIVFDSLRLSFDQFLPISGARPPPGAKSSPFVWVKVRADWKARRGQARDEGGECGICLESLKTGRRPGAGHCLWDCPLRGAGVTLRSWRIVSDQLIIWYYDTLSIMTASSSPSE